MLLFLYVFLRDVANKNKTTFPKNRLLLDIGTFPYVFAESHMQLAGEFV